MMANPAEELPKTLAVSAKKYGEIRQPMLMPIITMDVVRFIECAGE